MLVDLTKQLDKTQRLLSQLLAAKGGTRSEQLSADQLRLFAQELAPRFPLPNRNRKPTSHTTATIFHLALAPAVAKAALGDGTLCQDI